MRLHFAEPEGLPPGARVFTVSLEGRPVLQNFDIAREAGGDRTLVKELLGVEVKGALDIALFATSGTPVLSGVELQAE